MKQQARSRGTKMAKRSRRKKAALKSLARQRAGFDFFASPTLDDLAKAQGVGPLTDPKVLMGGWPEEDDVDAFLEETYRERDASANA